MASPRSEYEAALEAYLAKNARDRAAPKAERLKKYHAYSLAEYGLSAAEVRRELGWYYDEYMQHVPSSAASGGGGGANDDDGRRRRPPPPPPHAAVPEAAPESDADLMASV